MPLRLEAACCQRGSAQCRGAKIRTAREAAFARSAEVREGKSLTPKGSPLLRREIPHPEGKSLTPKGSPLLRRETTAANLRGSGASGHGGGQAGETPERPLAEMKVNVV